MNAIAQNQENGRKWGMEVVENGEILSLLLSIEFLNLRAAVDLIRLSAQGTTVSAVRKYQNIRLKKSKAGPQNLNQARRRQRKVVTVVTAQVITPRPQ